MNSNGKKTSLFQESKHFKPDKRSLSWFFSVDFGYRVGDAVERWWRLQLKPFANDNLISLCTCSTPSKLTFLLFERHDKSTHKDLRLNLSDNCRIRSGKCWRDSRSSVSIFHHSTILFLLGSWWTQQHHPKLEALLCNICRGEREERNKTDKGKKSFNKSRKILSNLSFRGKF